MINENSKEIIKKALLKLQDEIFQQRLDSEKLMKKYHVFFTPYSKGNARLDDFKKILKDFYDLEVSYSDLVQILSTEDFSNIIQITRYTSQQSAYQDIYQIQIQNPDHD